MTDDQTPEPARTPLQLATEAIRELQGDRPADPKLLAQAALAAAAISYTPPERPVELTVRIEDEDGADVEQTFSLTRTQAADATKLGYSLVGAARCVLEAYYGVADGDPGSLGEAIEAGAAALDAR